MDSPLKFSRPQQFDTQRWLYHYTTCQTALEFIISDNGSLRLNQLGNVNDPRESKFVGFSMFGGDESVDAPEMFQRVSAYFRNKIKIACFSQDDNRIPVPPNIATEPFIRGYCKPRMWATYGDNHKGVCLVFDSNELLTAFAQQFSDVRSGRVHYDDVVMTTSGWMWRDLVHNNAFSFDLGALNSDFNGEISNMIEAHFQKYFFNKHEDWTGENEYRLVLHGQEESPQYLDYGKSLVGVAVGMDCENDNIENLVGVADRLGIPIVQPDWSLQNWGQKNLNEIAKSTCLFD